MTTSITRWHSERPWPKRMTVAGMLVRQNASTRRMKRLAYKQAMVLRRIKKLLARELAQRENLDIRRHVRTLKAAKRLPHQRVRTQDALAFEKIENPYTLIRNARGDVTSISVWDIMSSAEWGIRKVITDFRPIAFLSPPRNPTTIGSFRTNSLKASAIVTPSILSRPIVIMPKSKWPIWGLDFIGIDGALPQPISFTASYADRVLQKAMAKVYEAEIQTNEYLVEWHQVARLIKDPLKTLLTFHKVLERWTRRDAWIWIPQRRYRKFGDGMLVSKAPPGGVLMSMRTRRTLSVDEVSSTVLTAACNRWLQYRYGIAPIVADLTKVYGLWLHPAAKPELDSKSARLWVSRPAKVVSSYATRRGPLYFTFKRVYVKGENYSAKVFFRRKGEVPTSYKCGLHPSQWPNVLWNAVPYSFVADWVINHDEWMTAQRNVPWIEILGNTVTRKVFEHARSTCISVQETTYGQAGIISGSPIAIRYVESINRKVNWPGTSDHVLSTAWQSVKNALTAAALVLAPLGQSHLKNLRKQGK